MKDRSSDAGGRSKALRLQARGYHSPAGAPPTLAAPARASWAHAAATARGVDHHVASQVFADGTKITNTGTDSEGGLVDITALPLRPSASEGLDASLARRSGRLRPSSR